MSQYKRVSPKDETNVWAQTLLPFNLKKASKKGEVYVVPGELEFKFNISQKDKVKMFLDKPE